MAHGGVSAVTAATTMSGSITASAASSACTEQQDGKKSEALMSSPSKDTTDNGPDKQNDTSSITSALMIQHFSSTSGALAATTPSSITLGEAGAALAGDSGLFPRPSNTTTTAQTVDAAEVEGFVERFVAGLLELFKVPGQCEEQDENRNELGRNVYRQPSEPKEEKEGVNYDDEDDTAPGSGATTPPPSPSLEAPTCLEAPALLPSSTVFDTVFDATRATSQAAPLAAAHHTVGLAAEPALLSRSISSSGLKEQIGAEKATEGKKKTGKEKRKKRQRMGI